MFKDFLGKKRDPCLRISCKKATHSGGTSPFGQICEYPPRALHQMRNGKAPETDGILAEFGKVSGEEGENILQHLCTLIWKSEE